MGGRGRARYQTAQVKGKGVGGGQPRAVSKEAKIHCDLLRTFPGEDGAILLHRSGTRTDSQVLEKMAGAELEHAVVWLDRPHVPGAAYTAMSRVFYGANLLLGGMLTPDNPLVATVCTAKHPEVGNVRLFVSIYQKNRA